jgi:hypothetical protein
LARLANGRVAFPSNDERVGQRCRHFRAVVPESDYVEEWNMRKLTTVVMVLLAMCVISIAQNEPKKAEPPKDISTVLQRSLSGVEKNMVGMAEAMPEDKYNFVPKDGEFKGVRTFALQVRHVAAVNYLFGSLIAGEKPPVDPGPEENGPELKTKAEIVKQLQDSFAYVHKAFGGITADKALETVKMGDYSATRLGLAVLTVSHVNDHYGQCVVYLRMNGIVPPASRK